MSKLKFLRNKKKQSGGSTPSVTSKSSGEDSEQKKSHESSGCPVAHGNPAVKAKKFKFLQEKVQDEDAQTVKTGFVYTCSCTATGDLELEI